MKLVEVVFPYATSRSLRRRGANLPYYPGGRVAVEGMPGVALDWKWSYADGDVPPCRRWFSRPARPADVPSANGMMVGMTAKAKIAVSLPAELVARAQQAVADGRAPSVSAYVADALEQKSRLDDLAALLDEMLAATGGPLTPEEAAAADRMLGR